MAITNYIDSNGLRLMVAQLPSGAFDLYFSNVGVIRRESVENQSDFVNEGIETILDRLGIKSDKPLTRKEYLLAFIGFKAGLMWERLAEIQTKSASPDPIEMVIMGILKNGKNADFIVVFTAEVSYL